MTPIHHVALPADWDAAGDDYRISTRGRTLDDEGFVHCSYEHQLAGVLAAFYADVEEVVILTIDPTGLDVRDEPPAPGVDDLFPHVYGPIPRSAVIAVARRGLTPERNGGGTDAGVTSAASRARP